MNDNDILTGLHRIATEPSPRRRGPVKVYEKTDRDSPSMGAIIGILALIVLLVLLIIWLF
jgi:hypothetical protein